MPSIRENFDKWSQRDWSAGGDEWSVAWGGSPSLWWSTLFPRIRQFLPAAAALEIAPGAGRITQFLKEECDRLDLVDLSSRCTEICRERFAADAHVQAHVGDGRSLSMIGDATVDFAISFDSLVHVEDDVIGAYLRELARVLTPGGVAFLHHSNLGAFAGGDGQPTIDNPAWRATSVSAARFAELADRARLACTSQEVVNWGGDDLTDCFSVVVRGTPSGPPRRVENSGFMREVERAALVAWLYAPAEVHDAARRNRNRKGWRRRLRSVLGP